MWSADGAGQSLALRTALPDLSEPPPAALALAFLDGDQTLLAKLEDGTTRRWFIDANKLKADCRVMVI